MKQYDDFKSDQAYERYLRRYYSGLAMQSLINASTYSLSEIKQGGCCDIAEVSVIIADQLIVELNKQNQ